MDIETSVHVSEETIVEIQDADDEIELEDTTEHVSLENNITATEESESIKKSKSIRKYFFFVCNAHTLHAMFQLNQHHP